jgi:hypothetical protein
MRRLLSVGARAAEERVAGERPSATKALVVAVGAGAATAALTYKALRSAPAG